MRLKTELGLFYNADSTKGEAVPLLCGTAALSAEEQFQRDIAL